MLTYSDKLHISVIAIVETIAISINVSLILAIIFKTPKRLRPYSVFLLNNAIIDLASASSCLMATVRLIQDHSGSILYVFLGPCSLISANLCLIFQDMHMSLVLHSTLILLLSFAYRLYIIGNIVHQYRPTSVQIWFICILTYSFTAAYSLLMYSVQDELTPEMEKRFGLEEYVTANYDILSTQATIVDIIGGFLSPLVLFIIFVVRRKLIRQIVLATTDRKQHEHIARALTYQLLLPCGGAAGATLWFLDVYNIWSNELNERLVMLLFSVFSLASPIINFTMLPPYRALLPWKKNSVANSGNQSEDYITITG